MLNLKNEVIEVSTGAVTNLGADEGLINAAKEELKEIFESDITYRKINDSLHINRAWIGESKKECLCLVLNDKISIYIDENIEVVCGDIITGEWLDLDIEECNNIFNDILKMLVY